MNPTTSCPAVEALTQQMTHQMVQLIQAVATQFQDGSSTLAAVEQAVLPAIRDLGATLIAGLCGVLTSSPLERTLPCACGHHAQYQRMRSATVTTILGPMQLLRAYYLCPVCHQGHAPADTTLQIVAGSVSDGLAEVMALLGATQDSFAEAASVLERLTLVHVCPNSIRQVTESLGVALLTEDTQTAMPYQDSRTCPVQESASVPRIHRRYISMDGIQVHFRGGAWGEVKVGCVYQTITQPHTRQPDQLVIRLDDPSYCVRRGDPAAFGALLWQDAVRRGVLDADEVIIVGDGSAWIWGIADTQFPGATQILDWYHASSYVWSAALAIHPTDAAQRQQWATIQVTALWESRVDDVLTELARVQHLGEAITTTMTYYTNQRSRMDYVTYRARGLQIGSGSIESACKQLVTSRLKGAGMIWDADGAEAVATVRAYLKSRRWDEAMARRPRRQRTYARTGQMVSVPCPAPDADAVVSASMPSSISGHATDGAPSRRTPIPPEVHTQVRAELAAERANHRWRRWQGQYPSPRQSSSPSRQAVAP